jgi:hypothetical protein
MRPRLKPQQWHPVTPSAARRRRSGNIISGNAQDGIQISGSSNTTANVVQGNFIGTDASGAVALGNGTRANFEEFGVRLSGQVSNNGVNGNVISGNVDGGVSLDAGASGNRVDANIIGLNSAGNAALGNNRRGLLVQSGASNNTVTRNIIAGNAGVGLYIFGTNTNANSVQSNIIGTDAARTATALGNADSGIRIEGGAQNNTIGGGASNENTIAFNGADGITIRGNTTVSNRVLSTSIFANRQLGISFRGDNIVTFNDPNDADTGPNNLQNYPVLNTAVSNGTNTVVRGTLNSIANATFNLQFFSNATCDSSGNGEGQTFLGSASVTTDTNGNASFNSPLPNAVAPGQFITATATDAAGNTSEFSACLAIAAVLEINNTNDSGAGSLRQALLDANARTGGQTIVFNLPGTSVQTFTPASPLPTINVPVIIDGTTQPGYNGRPLIRLDGRNASSGNGLTLGAGSNGSIIRGLAIVRFSGAGIELSSSNNTVAACFLGTDASNALGAGNAAEGIIVRGANNIIGGLTAGERNVINNNVRAGVSLSGSAATANMLLGQLHRHGRGRYRCARQSAHRRRDQRRHRQPHRRRGYRWA